LTGVKVAGTFACQIYSDNFPEPVPMTNVRIPHQAWVLVGDGRKALVLRNEGDEMFPNLRALTVFKEEVTPPTSELGTDAPGRAVEHLTGRRSGMEQTDWHDIAEHKFAQSVASTLCAADHAGDISALVVVAPPRTLADLRDSFTDSLKAKVIAEVNKDLTKHPVYEIERLLTGLPKK
jgi:protein required for attachment to host cells